MKNYKQAGYSKLKRITEKHTRQSAIDQMVMYQLDLMREAILEVGGSVEENDYFANISVLDYLENCTRNGVLLTPTLLGDRANNALMARETTLEELWVLVEPRYFDIMS